MATKVANPSGPSPQTPHTSGLYADMTLDGPEIGTLVIVFDRAKNLPNRKTMGKQNPYCAARLGKEAKKTETDRRGGQTPRWDQEVRFIVHDSPDYHKVKISVFSEDKRTDLVGEAWVDLTQVIVPGGGKSDFWQTLSFKGKYAGELRIELTYYDERPKPVEPVPDLLESSRVKRRPLPSNPNLRNLTPDTIPGPAIPGRAKHGPRDLSMPPRANSMPPEVNYFQPHPGYHAPAPVSTHGHHYGSSPPSHIYQTPPNQYGSAQVPYQEPQTYAEAHYSHPELLPQLPPIQHQRNSLPIPPGLNTGQDRPPPQHRSLEHMGLLHSHSSPAVPTTHEVQPWNGAYQLSTDYPEPLPDGEYQYQRLEARPRTAETSQALQIAHWDPHMGRQSYTEEDHPPPPPPPMHSYSSPAVAQRSMGQPASSPMPIYAMTPPSARYNAVPNSSPLQNFERQFSTPPRSPGQASHTSGPPSDMYTPPSDQRGFYSSPPGSVPSQTSSPFARPQPANRPTPNRHSIADPYNTGTPTRPHPLSQEVPQNHSPPQLPGSSPHAGVNPPYPTQYRSRDGLPLIKPRPVSPQAPSQPPSQPSSAPRSKSSYDIQFPVRAFESSDKSPLSMSQSYPRVAQLSNPATPIRKSTSPHATPPHSAGAIPYSPDSFNVHNPNTQSSTLPNGNSPHSPYQIRPGSEALPRDEPSGPIVDSHGNEVDPSDRLPMNSWAPEPEKKTPTRTYGLGRDRDFGPRSPLSTESAPIKNISKDTVMRPRTQTQAPPPETSPVRNRLQKKSTPIKNQPVQPLQERHNFNSNSPLIPSPYEQQEFNRGFYSHPYDQPTYAGSYAAMSDDALSREISSIDIGGSRHARSGSVPAPTAYMPVRSHKDRKTLF